MIRSRCICKKNKFKNKSEKKHQKRTKINKVLAVALEQLQSAGLQRHAHPQRCSSEMSRDGAPRLNSVNHWRRAIAISAENAGCIGRRARTADVRGDAPRIAAMSEIIFDLRERISYSRTCGGYQHHSAQSVLFLIL